MKTQEVLKVDVDVLQAKIQRGFTGRFEAELVGVMARSLITGEPVKLVYNDQAYTVKGAV